MSNNSKETRWCSSRSYFHSSNNCRCKTKLLSRLLIGQSTISLRRYHHSNLFLRSRRFSSKLLELSLRVTETTHTQMISPRSGKTKHLRITNQRLSLLQLELPVPDVSSLNNLNSKARQLLQNSRKQNRLSWLKVTQQQSLILMF